MSHIAAVLVSTAAKATMIEEIDRERAVETGGLLLGEYDASDRAHVMAATGPGPNARKTKNRVDFDARFLQQEQDRLMHEASHLRFLGDWHYHPQGDGAPSSKDGRVLMELTCDPDYQLGGLATILVLYSDRFLHVRAFRLRRPSRLVEIPAQFAS
jgi:integrative and conjugative element protein (TIGR02256 family)